MPEQSSGEKTEAPTPKKLRDAREKGQVAKSQDVSSTALLVLLFAMFQLLWGWMLHHGGGLITQGIDFATKDFSQSLVPFSWLMLKGFVLLSLPFVGGAALAGIGVNYLQVGALFSVEAVKPKFEKINPFEGLKRIFSAKSFFEFGKNLIKISVLGFVAWKVMEHSLSKVLLSSSHGLESVMSVSGGVMAHFCWIVATVYIFFAGADFFFQRFQYIKELRMTKDEVKREFKETEGSPEAKSYRKQIAQEIAMNEAVENTKDASVLVTNPTHYAVALHYKADEKLLPSVVAKGQGALALKMMEVARKNGVPIMRNVPLAQTLYHEVDLYNYIPRELIESIAEVLKWAKEQRQNSSWG